MSSKAKSVSTSASKSQPKTSGEKRSNSPIHGADPMDVSDAEPAVKKGKAAFLAQLNDVGYEPTRVLKSSKGAAPTTSFEVVVTSTKAVTLPSKKEGGTPIPKLEITGITRQIRTNGAIDCIDSGIPGVGHLLPTQRDATEASSTNDAGPEAALANKGSSGGGNSERKAPPRTLRLSPDGHKTISTHFVRTSIYTTAPGGNSGGASDGSSNNANSQQAKVDVDRIKPGCVVEITGNVANLAPDGKTVWLNSSRVTPLSTDIASGEETQALMDAFMNSDAAQTSTVFASQAAFGFFGIDFGNDKAREEQAACIHKQWVSLVHQSAKACESLATTLRSSSADEEANAKVLDAHAVRLQGTSAIDIATGASLMFIPPMMPTQDRPAFVAPLVQRGKHPALPTSSIMMDLVERQNLEKIPDMFTTLDVKEVVVQGALINVKCGLMMIGNKELALKAFADGQNPVLTTGKFAGIGFNIGMRSFCGTIGTLVKSKADMVSKEILIDADMAVVAKISPKPHNSDGLVCLFPESFSIDMPNSIMKVAIPVSETYVQEKLAGGNSQFVYEADDTIPKIKDKDNRTDVSVRMPQLKADGYQPISETGFKFGAKTPIDKPLKKYFVMYEGCRNYMADAASMTTDEGETLIDKVAGGAEHVEEFLTASAIVYCVACFAPAE